MTGFPRNAPVAGADHILGGDNRRRPAGTSDLSVAEEARVTCGMFGSRAFVVSDLEVTGIHRLLDRLDEIRQARVIIVAVGMEGALASVIGGSCPSPSWRCPPPLATEHPFRGSRHSSVCWRPAPVEWQWSISTMGLAQPAPPARSTISFQPDVHYLCEKRRGRRQWCRRPRRYLRNH